MKACYFDGLLNVLQREKPSRGKGEVLIRVTKAGICNTDHEIVRGYIPGFKGIPGHEFIGIVEESDETELLGKRCTAEINCSCGKCEYCKRGLGRHCPQRSVLGIIHRNGAFAEYVCVPKGNVVLIPDSISDSLALFIEPLAAALEIIEQIKISPQSNVLIFGDGKLGLLCASVLATVTPHITLVGKHPKKLQTIQHKNIQTHTLESFKSGKYDIVVEATGNPKAFSMALQNVKPRGTLILKSTYADTFNFNPSELVVNEIALIGSRCGVFSEAISFLLTNQPPFQKLISHKFHLSDAVKAFEWSKRSDTLKVILTME